MTQTPQRRINATRSEQLPRSGLVQRPDCAQVRVLEVEFGAALGGLDKLA